MSLEILSTIACGYIITSAILFFYPQIVHVKKKLPFTPRHISHRGGAGEHLENTMSAFKHAVKLGTDMLEIDCQLTKDGHVVVSHDNCLKRVTGHDVNISETNFKDLPLLQAELELASDFGHVHLVQGNGDRKIILLRDFFEAFPDIPVNLDIKENVDELIKKVNDLIVEFNREDITVWGNKTEVICEKCYKTNPKIPRVFSLERMYWLIFLFYTGLLPFVSLKEYCVEIPIPRMYLKKQLDDKSTWHKIKRGAFFLLLDLIFMNRLFFYHLKKRDVHVYLWVINSDDEFRIAKHFNVTGIMTDFPSKFLEGGDQ